MNSNGRLLPSPECVVYSPVMVMVMVVVFAAPSVPRCRDRGLGGLQDESVTWTNRCLNPGGFFRDAINPRSYPLPGKTRVMEWLNEIGSIASVIGLAVTFYTLYKVTNLPAELKRQSRDRQLSELIERVTSIPLVKPTIPDSTAREVEALIKTIRLYYVSGVPFRQRKLKSLLDILEAELGGEKQLRVVQLQLRLIRDEITIR